MIKPHTAMAVIAVFSLLVTTVFLLLSEPIPQPLSYHAFADTQPLLGIANGADVLSSLPFVAVGLWGLWRLRRTTAKGALAHDNYPGYPVYGVFFAAVAITGLGSAWYHLAPDNSSLVWDRLPMALGFMALTTAILAEHLDRALQKKLLYPLLVAGVATVLYWHYTEQTGVGDLRPYVVVQFLPMIILPLVVLTRPSRFTRAGDLWLVLAFYGLAKLMELLDSPIYQLLGISGHTIKHLLAALAAWWVLRMLYLRQPIHLPASAQGN
jgi:hypothetical protein